MEACGNLDTDRNAMFVESSKVVTAEATAPIRGTGAFARASSWRTTMRPPGVTRKASTLRLCGFASRG